MAPFWDCWYRSRSCNPLARPCGPHAGVSPGRPRWGLSALAAHAMRGLVPAAFWPAMSLLFFAAWHATSNAAGTEEATAVSGSGKVAVLVALHGGLSPWPC